MVQRHGHQHTRTKNIRSRERSVAMVLEKFYDTETLRYRLRWMGRTLNNNGRRQHHNSQRHTKREIDGGGWGGPQGIGSSEMASRQNGNRSWISRRLTHIQCVSCYFWILLAWYCILEPSGIWNSHRILKPKNLQNH